MSATLVTVTGTFLTPEAGEPASGTITATLQKPMRNGLVQYDPAPVLGVLNEAGELKLRNGEPFQLPATDDTGTVPSGVSYAWTIDLDNGPTRTFYAPLPHTPASVDIAELGSTSGSSPSITPAPSSATQVESYRAVAANDAAMWELAITAASQAGTASGKVQGGAGIVYNFAAGSVPVIPKGLPAPGLELDGSDCTLRLTAEVPRCFDFIKVADGDTFQNVYAHDFWIDCNAVGGKHHIFMGNYRGGVVQTKVSFSNVRTERIRGYNAPPPDPSGTDDRRWIALWTQNDHTDPLVTLKHITHIGDDFKGGSYGFSVVASRVTNTSGEYANAEHDDILMFDCHHDTTVVPTAFATSANFHIGSRGFGKSVRLIACTGTNSADVGIEIDGMTDALAFGCVITDQWTTAYFATNFATVPNLAAQRVKWHNCLARRHAQNTRKESASGTIGYSSTVQAEFATQYVSRVELVSCTYHKEDGTFHTKGEAALIKGTRKILLRDFGVVYEAIVYNEENGHNFTPAAIYLQNGVGGGAMGQCEVTARNVTQRIIGERTTSPGREGTVTYNPVMLGNTGELVFDWDGLDLDFDVTGLTSTAFRGFQIGESSAGQQTGGKLRNYRINKLNGDASPRAFVLQDTAWITVIDRIELIDCDFSKMSGGEEIAFSTGGGGTAQVTKVAARNCRPRTGSVKLEGAVASAATVTLPPQGEVLEVTGTTDITRIEPAPSGRRVTLRFTNAAPGKLVSGETLKLAGTYSPAQNNTITLASDGANWYETGRAAVT